MRKRDISGERRFGSVKNAIPVRPTVLVKTLLRPRISAPPNVGSRKYFCASSQVTISRVSGCPEHGRGVPGSRELDGGDLGCEIGRSAVPFRSHGM